MSWSDAGLFVFDLDGTLIDSVADIAAAVNETLGRLEPTAAPLSVERVRAHVGNGARLLISRSLKEVEGTTDVDRALTLFRECYRRRLLDNTRLYPGVAEGLERLAGRPLAVLTNKPGDMARTILEGLGVAGRFFRVIGGGDGVPHKPDPSGLRRLIDEAEVTPAETVMIGDSAVDIETGRRAGTRTVGVSYGFAPHELEGAAPDLLIEDLRRLADLARGSGPPVLG